MHKGFVLAKNSLLSSVLVAVFCLAVLSTGVLAEHTATITISPDVANCDQLGNTFTVNVKNDDTSIDNILQVEIYKALAGISDFECGDAPTGWTLFSYQDRCIYVTGLNSPDKIAPGEDLDFTFDAVMSSDSCESEFIVVTVDDAYPQGDRVTNSVYVDIDCTPPTFDKDVIGPQVGTCPPGETGECWVMDHKTDIKVQVYDNENNCDLGLDYCTYRIWLDGAKIFEHTFDPADPEPGIGWQFEFEEDSVHILEIVCEDMAGNKLEDNETFHVDSTPPTTTKQFIGPQKIVPIPGTPFNQEWIDGVTTINLSSTDPDPTGEGCNIGVDKTWYRIDLLKDEGEAACYEPQTYCDEDHVGSDTPYDEESPGCIDECQVICGDSYGEGTDDWYDCVESCAHNLCYVDEDWHLYRGEPIGGLDESCHVIQFFSVDHLGNIEDTNFNCFFVDDTPPFGEKWVGQPAFTEINLNQGEEEYYVVRVENPTDNDITGDLKLIGNVESSPGVWEGISSDEMCTAISEDISYYFDPYWGGCNGPNGNGCGPDSPGQTFEGWLLSHPDWLDWYVTDIIDNKGCGNDNLYDPNPGVGGDDPDIFPGIFWSNGELVLPGQTIPAHSVVWGVVKIKAKTGGKYRFGVEGPDGLVFSQTGWDQEEFTWVRDHVTPITLTCEDQGPHPVDHEKVCYKVGLDDNDVTADYCDEGLTDDGYCCVDSQKEIVFNEDSNHELTYYCEDALGNKNTEDTEYFRVDSQPPVITKTMLGTEGEDYLGDCPPEGEGDVCYVADNGEGGVHVDVQDGGEICAVDDITCDYEVWWETSADNCEDANGIGYDNGWCLLDEGSFDDDGTDILFHEDSTHKLIINCEDALGNEMPTDVEEFLVDSTPPETTKTYGNPTYVDDGYRWITSDTPITLTAEDEKVGVDKIFWRTTLLDIPDQNCVEQCDYEGSGGWHAFQVTNVGATRFYIEDESCHLIEFYSVDKLGNTENIKKQCVFVDNTPPATTKEIGEPKVVVGEDTYISQQTPITLTCEDQEPHPVDHSSIKYRYRYADTCDSLNEAEWTEWMDPDGGDPVEKTIQFPEDSCHELQYYCEDALGNAEDVHSETDIVDTKPPEITFTVNEPYYYDETGALFIDSASSITVDATDPQPHPVDNVKCTWSYTVNGEPTGDSNGEVQVPFTLQFPEESHHVLTVTCKDALGNENTSSIDFYADHTPPGIGKKYGKPYFEYENDYYAEFINSSTPIYAGVWDDGPHKSGIAEVKYRVTLLDNDEYCKDYGDNDDYKCEDAVGEGEWTIVDPEYYSKFEFNIPEESCHLIEIVATDNVGKTNEHKQCVFVDNSAPEPDKKVGEPKWMWDGSDANYYDIADKCWKNEEGETLNEEECKADPYCMECWRTTLLTPIYLECKDPEPHPVEHETVCFNVEWDAEDVTENYCEGGEMIENEKYGKNFCCVDHEMVFNFGETTEHELEYYCKDALGNEGETLDVEKFKVEDTAFNITLNKKWNLISVPVFLLEDNPDAVFQHIKDKVKGVWTYDPTYELCGDLWCAWFPGPAGDNLNEILPGWGYWVLMDDGAVLTIGGSLMRPGPVGQASKKIVPGWNLIGYYGADGLTSYEGPYGNGGEAYCELYSLGEDIWDKEFTGLFGYWEPDNPYQWKEYERYDSLDPGAGYWLATPHEGEYTPSSDCGWL